MTRIARSYRWPDITIRQLDELEAITGLNQTHVIRSAVALMWNQETKTMTYRITVSPGNVAGTIKNVVWEGQRRVGGTQYSSNSEKAAEAAERIVQQILENDGASEAEIDAAYAAE